MESTTHQKVFDAIKDLLADQEFLNANTAFHEKNCDLFVADDENKLEYTEIYHEYVKIIEDTIEAKLKIQHEFSEEQIEAFYTHFKESYKSYEASDKETVDTLFNFTDFEKFKASMINMKTEKGEGAGVAIDQDLYDLQQGSIKEAYESFKVLRDEPNTSWTKKVDQQKIKNGLKYSLYQKKQDKGVDLIKVNVMMEGVDAKHLVDMWFDPPKTKEIEEIKTIERTSENSAVLYMRMKLPMMSKRDSLFTVDRQFLDDKTTFFHAKTIERDDVPPLPKVIRMFLHTRATVTQEDGYITYTEISQADMKGSVPSKLMNMVIASATGAQLQQLMKDLKAK